MSSRGVDLWGAAATAPGWPATPPLPTAVSFALRLRPASLEGLERGPNEAEVREYRRVNDELIEIGEACVALFRAHGYAGERVDDDAPDGPTDPEIFASKTAATQAGLGWIGKTALLVTPQFGSSVRLGTVFTDLRLPTGTPVTTGCCGSCRACVDACPVDAGRDVAWRAGVPRGASCTTARPATRSSWAFPTTTRSAASVSGSAPTRSAPCVATSGRSSKTATRRRGIDDEVRGQGRAGHGRQQRDRSRHGAPARERGRGRDDLRARHRPADVRPATARGSRRQRGRGVPAT